MSDAAIGLDPITFEILSSRLSAINDEAATTMRLVSGSPVANEAYDMNVGLMNAEGDCIAIGVYISIHALSLSVAVASLRTTTRKSSIMPSRAVDSTQTFVLVPQMTIVSRPMLRSSRSRLDEPGMKHE